MLGSLILYLKGIRRMMFQLSGFYYRVYRAYRCKIGFGVQGVMGFGGILRTK